MAFCPALVIFYFKYDTATLDEILNVAVVVL